MVTFLVEGLGGQKADGLCYGGLEETAKVRVGGTVSWESLTEGKER